MQALHDQADVSLELEQRAEAHYVAGAVRVLGIQEAQQARLLQGALAVLLVHDLDNDDLFGVSLTG